MLTPAICPGCDRRLEGTYIPCRLCGAWMDPFCEVDGKCPCLTRKTEARAPLSSVIRSACPMCKTDIEARTIGGWAEALGNHWRERHVQAHGKLSW